MYITPTYTVILGVIFLWLSFNSIRHRRKYRIAVGDGGNEGLLRAIRAHANFGEYVPFCLLMIYMFENNGGYYLAIHAMNILLLTGRVIHAVGIMNKDENIRFRVTGMLLTFVTMMSAMVGNLLLVIF